MKDVKSTIQRYVNGTKEGNIAILSSVFHPRAIMSGDLGPNKLVLSSPEIFFNDIEGEKADEQYDYTIESITVKGAIASVVLSEKGLKGAAFENHFQLQKIDGRWLIISKLFTTV